MCVLQLQPYHRLVLCIFEIENTEQSLGANFFLDFNAPINMCSKLAHVF